MLKLFLFYSRDYFQADRFIHLLYLSRFRNQTDRKKVFDLFQSVFGLRLHSEMFPVYEISEFYVQVCFLFDF